MEGGKGPTENKVKEESIKYSLRQKQKCKQRKYQNLKLQKGKLTSKVEPSSAPQWEVSGNFGIGLGETRAIL